MPIRRPLLAIASAAAVVGLVAGLALGRLSSPTLSAQVADLRSRAGAVTTSLEVLRLEYGKAVGGGVDAGGGDAALVRARLTFRENAATLSLIDPGATRAAQRSLDSLATLVGNRASASEVEATIDQAEQALERLASSQPAGG